MPPTESETQRLERIAASLDRPPSRMPPPVMMHVGIESKLGLWPSESQVGRTSDVDPLPAKRARRRRRP